MDVGIEQVVIACANNGDGVPLGFCAIVVDIGQVSTVFERITANIGDAIRNI